MFKVDKPMIAIKAEVHESFFGLIVSLPEPIIDRLFHHRTIYVHPSSDTSPSLKVGDRVFFYDSGSHKLIGEALIARTAFETPERVAEYGHQLFLSEEELQQYLQDHGFSKDGLMLVLRLSAATKYMNPMRCPRLIPPSGLGVTREVYNEIVTANK